MGKPKRDHIVTARLTDAEFDELQAQASRRGLSVSDFIRQAIKPRALTWNPPYRVSTATMTCGASGATVTYNAA